MYSDPPVIAGHEFACRVVQLGEGAGEKYGLSIGDLAVSEQIVPCWECKFCKTGRYWMCMASNVYGFRKNLPGSMAEYMKLPAGSLNYKVPEGMTARQAAVVEPLACAIHAVQRAKIEMGDVVVIAGAGTLGLGMVATARLLSPGLLVSVDARDHRLDVARQLGADLTINVSKEDAVAKILDLTDGYGCDVYIEAAGNPDAVIQGLRMIRKLGRFVEFSVMPSASTVDWSIIGDMKELDIFGAHLSPYTYPLALDDINRGLIDVDPIVTHELPLEQFKTGFEMMHSVEESIKVLLKP